jgi:hypothetical protein
MGHVSGNKETKMTSQLRNAGVTGDERNVVREIEG